MCKFIDDTLAKGRAEGLVQGLEQGRAEALSFRMTAVKNLLEMGMDHAFIARALSISEAEVQQLIQ